MLGNRAGAPAPSGVAVSRETFHPLTQTGVFRMELTRRQKLQFYEEGYLKIPGVVPRVMVDAARHAMNHSIGEEGMYKEDLAAMRSRSYCRELQNAPVLTDLFNQSPIIPLAESLVGAGNVQPAGSAQIA